MAKRHSKESRVYVDIYDLSGHSNSLTQQLNRTLNDCTTLLDTGRRYQPSVSEDRFGLEGFYSDDADGLDVALSALKGAEKTVSLWGGGDALGSIGKGGAAAMGQSYTLSSRVGELVTAQTDVSFNGTAQDVKSLGTKATVTATTAGTSIDDSASSSDGGVFLGHILALSASGGNAQWKVQLQDSADNSSWATVEEVVRTNAQGPVAFWETFTGDLRRYVRLRVERDATSGSITAQASYQRG